MSSTPSARNAAWIAGLQAGDVEIFRAIYETYMPELWHYAKRFVPSDVAEDIIQDVMADLWDRRETIEIRGTIAQYLFGAMHYRVLNHRRRSRVLEAIEYQDDTETTVGMGTAPQSPEAVVLEQDLKTALTAAVAKLSPIQRSVLELRWLQEMSYDQIAQILGISVEAARQHVSRAQRTVRPVLQQFLDDR